MYSITLGLLGTELFMQSLIQGLHLSQEGICLSKCQMTILSLEYQTKGLDISHKGSPICQLTTTIRQEIWLTNGV